MDIQPGLHVVLSETNGANVIRHVHSLRGIHANKDAANNWEWPLQDGLGSVREVVDNSVAVLESRNYEPFGTGFGNTGISQTNYGFTGEQTDGSGLVYLRNRYMSPTLGQFFNLDPLEGINRYAYVGGNPIGQTDPSGLCPENPAPWDVPGNVCRSTALRLAEAIGVAPNSFMWMDYGQLIALSIARGVTNLATSAHDMFNRAFTNIGHVIYPDLPIGPTPIIPPSPGVITAETAPEFPPGYDFPPNIIPDNYPFIPPFTQPPPGQEWLPWALLLCYLLNGGACNLEFGKGAFPNPGNSPTQSPEPTATRNTRRGPGGCKTYGTESISDMGDIAHIQIQNYFTNRYPPPASDVEVDIPGSGPAGGVGSADAILFDEGRRLGSGNEYAGIYEIKPISYSTNPLLLLSGAFQLNRYVRNYPGNAKAGTLWQPIDQRIDRWQLDPTQSLYVTTHYNVRIVRGLVFYYCKG